MFCGTPASLLRQSEQPFDRTLARLAAVLAVHDHPVWSEWMAEADQLRLGGDRRGAARKVLEAYGGMGSIMDSIDTYLLGIPPETYDELMGLLKRAPDEARSVRWRTSWLGRLVA